MYNNRWLLCALDTIIKFLNNNIDYKPFCVIIVECSGTGKSVISNAFIALIEKYTNKNDTIKLQPLMEEQRIMFKGVLYIGT